ncbi:MAG: hypothetical protein Q8O93_05190 [bacterium]|nr:hypothetical protein [bacterium]
MTDQSYTYLKDEIYYSEFYDKLTIEECRRWEKKEFWDVPSVKDTDPIKMKIKISFADKVVLPVALYAIKGERYAKKSETIRQWMTRDKAKDEQVANATEPKGIRCLVCSSLMSCISRDLHSDAKDKDKVLFMFECSNKGHKRRAYWENGEEWEPRPDLCSECKTVTNSAHVREGNLITTTNICPQCGHKETDTIDLNPKEEEVDPNFEANRKKYCLSEKEGGEYVSWTANSKHLFDSFKEREQHKEVYEAVAKIKTLAVIDLQNLLNPIIEKDGYTKLEFGKPEVKKDLFAEFTVQDNKPGRVEYDSRHGLEKLIKKALEGTNWRLMSDGISYKLGFLNGRLRGVSGEENLKEMITGEEASQG